MGYDPLIQYVTDKEYAKQYVSSVVGSNYTTETYRILRNKEELKTYVPDRFPCILKPTHSSGQAVICADRSGSRIVKSLGDGCICLSALRIGVENGADASYMWCVCINR